MHSIAARRRQVKMLIVAASLNYSNNIREEKEIILLSFQNTDQTAPVLPVRFFVVASQLSLPSLLSSVVVRGEGGVNDNGR